MRSEMKTGYPWVCAIVITLGVLTAAPASQAQDGGQPDAEAGSDVESDAGAESGSRIVSATIENGRSITQASGASTPARPRPEN